MACLGDDIKKLGFGLMRLSEKDDPSFRPSIEGIVETTGRSVLRFVPPEAEDDGASGSGLEEGRPVLAGGGKVLRTCARRSDESMPKSGASKNTRVENRKSEWMKS